MSPCVASSTLRIVIADQHTIFAEALQKLLEPFANIVGIATDGRQAVDVVRSTAPHVLLLAIMLPELNGFSAAREIAQISPRTKIIILTELTHSMYIRQALAAGAVGYLTKHSPAHELREAIDKVMAGERYVSPSLLPNRNGFHIPQNGHPEETGDLTPRQTEVLKLAAKGYCRKEIASLLAISIKTVEYHRAALQDRLGIRTTAELTQYAIRSGLI
jgi:DNA-binding NarL/FixJ family response regulator